MKKRLLLLTMLVCTMMQMRADVAINGINFPDENFRNYLQSVWYGLDGVITDAEIPRITNIGVYNKGIQSMKGIEYFTALTQLIYYESEPCLTSLDISKNTALTFLSCGGTLMTSIDLSKNTALKSLYLDSNQLTSLNLSQNTELTTLTCFNNQLTSLDLSHNMALERIDCYKNNIKGKDMDALVASLPVRSGRSGNIMVIYNENEQNVMTTTQVAAAKAKGWVARYYVDGNWQEYAGSESDEPMEKCATPTISFADGKVTFSCETEGVEYVAKVTCPASAVGDYEASSIPLTTTYIVTVYAKKDGYDNSEVATKEIEVSGGGAAGIRGDVNGDKIVNGTDIQEVINIIVEGQ